MTGDPHPYPRPNDQPGPRASDAEGPWRDRKVLVGICGGIAAYKVAPLVSHMAQGGAGVRVIMTDAATKFVGPLTFEALSGSRVLRSIWDADDHPESQHIGLARWCDLFIIAPATADILAKLAAGICDDLVCLTALALPRSPRATPLVLAPAMNADMWANPITQRNLSTVREMLGCHVVGPETGWQACRTRGPGRMSEPEAILAAAAKLLGEGMP